MEAKKETTADQSRRRHERVWFKHQATLELANGKSIWGITRDVSLRGVFLATAVAPSAVEKNQVGQLRLNVQNMNQAFPCRVVHVSAQGVGIELHERGEQFGAALTTALMHETQMRLGADVADTDYIRVVRLGSAASVRPEGRLVKVSASHLEFRFNLANDWLAKPGSEIKLEILQARHAPIVVQGIVRTILPTRDPAEKICALILGVLPDKTSADLKDLVRTLNDRRLQNMVTQRATSLGLQAGADLPRRTRPEIRQDLERFYGPRS
ncbi:MAG: PilZ domain-containing protein [Magnetococcales bacterium]|nr:PilZ domain-containing protein [Magnetococcales bacterium]